VRSGHAVDEGQVPAHRERGGECPRRVVWTAKPAIRVARDRDDRTDGPLDRADDDVRGDRSKSS
jgi:hypothetical protein